MLSFFSNGGPLMYPLLGCSLVALTVIMDRAIFWLQLVWRGNGAKRQAVLGFCQNGDWQTALKECSQTKDHILNVLNNGIEAGAATATKQMELAAYDVLKRMQRYMAVLDTVITVAPLLGILGTVIGIIASFDVLGASGIEQPRAVIAGIAQALITTATGLAIAVVTLLPYNYFNGRIRAETALIEEYATRLETVYARDEASDKS